MANTKYYLEQIKLENELKALLVKSANVEVTYNGAVMSLSDALTAICGSVSSVPTTSAMNAAIASAISASGHAHFEKADAVPDVADARENTLYLVKNAKTRHYDIYAKVAGEAGDSMELLDDTTVDLTGKLDKVTGATAGNLPTLDAGGGLADSGKKIGGAALAAAPDADTLATEAAVKAAIDAQPTATSTANGLMSAADKVRLDSAGKVWVGETAPSGMQNGDLFIRVVTAAEGA